MRLSNEPMNAFDQLQVLNNNIIGAMLLKHKLYIEKWLEIVIRRKFR